MPKFFYYIFFILLILNFNVANAEDVEIPEWVFIVYGFWTEEQISEQEFTDMLNYLEERDIIDLIFEKDYDVKTNFLLSIEQNQNPDQYTSCSSGWYVTGYFVPVEGDYSDKSVTITVNEESREFRQGFVDAIIVEGWGRTLSGDYLGWYDGSFHTSQYALDSHGIILTTGMIAIDDTIIDHDAKLMISTLPYPWNEIAFLSSDIGPSIKGKHIDLFTGEGKQAELETFRVTSYNNIVCK